MSPMLRCWCCREEFDLAGRCKCTKGECWRGDACQRKEERMTEAFIAAYIVGVFVVWVVAGYSKTRVL